MTHRTQTNEPGRCATLLPLLASLPQPLALVEVGASAGLCLYPDKYSYRYATSLGRHRLGDSEIVLSCTVTRPAPLPERLPEVGTRGVHWVSNEAPGVMQGADLDPRPRGRFMMAHDQVPVAVTGPHGHSLDWLLSAGGAIEDSGGG